MFGTHCGFRVFGFIFAILFIPFFAFGHVRMKKEREKLANYSKFIRKLVPIHNLIVCD